MNVIESKWMPSRVLVVCVTRHPFGVTQIGKPAVYDCMEMMRANSDLMAEVEKVTRDGWGISVTSCLDDTYKAAANMLAEVDRWDHTCHKKRDWCVDWPGRMATPPAVDPTLHLCRLSKTNNNETAKE